MKRKKEKRALMFFFVFTKSNFEILKKENGVVNNKSSQLNLFSQVVIVTENEK